MKIILASVLFQSKFQYNAYVKCREWDTAILKRVNILQLRLISGIIYRLVLKQSKPTVPAVEIRKFYHFERRNPTVTIVDL